VLKLASSRRYRQMTTEELARHFSVGKDRLPELTALLESLQERGLLVRVKKRYWVNPDRAGLVTGRMRCNPGGFGFVVPVREDLEDVYVAGEDMGQAMDGDLVVVEVHRQRPRRGGRRGRRQLGPSGRVIKVIEHHNRQVVGSFVAGSRFGRLVPDNPRLFREVYIARADWNGATTGDQVLVELTAWPSVRRNPEGVVREVLGRAGDPAVDAVSVMLEFGLPRAFPPEVIEQAARIPDEPPPAEVARRRDLRGVVTVTIDPEDAKDFDDALSFRRDEETGLREVMVHIADVSFFVRPDSPLDLEARKRGTSVYLADAVVPMLPPEQSKDALSLVEGKDRLAKTVAMRFDEKGKVTGYELFHSVINVDHRMSYTEVQAALEAADSEEPAVMAAAEKLPEELWTTIRELDRLAGQVGALRREVGSIDLDVPDYHVAIGQDGRVVTVTRIIRDRSHSLVEEFMLSANRAVADLTAKKRLPALYRVHEPPAKEDVQEFASFVQSVLGRRVNPLNRKELQALLAEVAGTNLADAVNMQLLRAMQRARYSPTLSAHFALHFERYCHFTSPVRRYPDLVVHQILDQFLREGRRPGALRAAWRDKLPSIAQHCNQMQERADEAEREIVKIKLLRYLEDHRNELFRGIITGVQEYGLFVRLQDYSVEGLIKVQDIPGDFYRLDERKKALVGTRTSRRFALGQELKVLIRAIDLSRRHLDLALAE